jgi:hypothetical protein
MSKVELTFNPTPDEREQMTAVAAQDDELRELTAGRIAYRVVENTNAYRRRHFFVIDHRKPVPFPTQWRHKNTSGVTFKRDEITEAEAWVKQALLAGFTVFYSSTKGTWGAGRSLAHGIYSEDGWWLHQELLARGLA